MTLRKLRRDYLRADRTAVTTLIDRMSDEDAMTRFSLEDRLDDLDQQLLDLDAEPETLTASAALFFGGRPVAASYGIESDFGGTALHIFQDLVSKVFADDAGRLGQRGVVANKSATTLHVTNIVRGSFGFLLEEVEHQDQIVESNLNASVQHTTKLLQAFGSSDEESFRSAVENTDERVLVAAKEFFGLMKTRGATLRLVSGETDQAFGSEAVTRAADRATTTVVTAGEEIFLGRLFGVLPEAHQFEFRQSHDTIRGSIDRRYSVDQIASFNKEWIDRDARARMMVRRVKRNGELVRESFTLLEIDEPASSASATRLDRL